MRKKLYTVGACIDDGLFILTKNTKTYKNVWMPVDSDNLTELCKNHILLVSDDLDAIHGIVMANLIATQNLVKTNKNYARSFAYYPLKVFSSKFPVKLVKEVGPVPLKDVGMGEAKSLIAYDIVSNKKKNLAE